MVVDRLDLIQQRSIMIHYDRGHRAVGQRWRVRRDVRTPDRLPGLRP